ncbi:hypothetical protein G6F56_007066 [Rhizopus delemar]|nr:hypothetical protein G6F56_007066 [Rhizopus delemar]
MAAMLVNSVQSSAKNNTMHVKNGAVFADYLTGLFNYLELEETPDRTLIMNCRGSVRLQKSNKEHLDDTNILLRKIGEGPADILAKDCTG